MSQFGVFANIVAMAGSLSAAAAAITLAFAKRAKWQPPQESVPAGVARISALVAMVFIALIFRFGSQLGPALIGGITLFCLLVAVVSLITAVQTNTKYSFFYPDNNETSRVLGGDTLTDEARRIKKQRGLTEQILYEHAQGAKDLVWTRDSLSRVQIKSTISYIGLIAFGTCALASAAMLVALFTGEPA